MGGSGSVVKAKTKSSVRSHFIISTSTHSYPLYEVWNNKYLREGFVDDSTQWPDTK